MNALDLYLHLEKYSNNHEQVLISHSKVPPIGDLLNTLLVLNTLQKKSGKKIVLAIWDNAIINLQWNKLFNWLPDQFISLPEILGPEAKNFHSLLNYGYFHGKGCIFIPVAMPHFEKINQINIPNLTPAMKQLFYLGLDPFESNNCIVKASDLSDSTITNNTKKQVLLIPHGNSVRLPSRSFYVELISQLELRGYEVIYDGSSSNPEINKFSSAIKVTGSIPDILGHAVNICKKGGIVISQRSGFSEFICNLGLRQIVLYPKDPPQSAFAGFDNDSGEMPYYSTLSMTPFFHRNTDLEKVLFWSDADFHYKEMQMNLHKFMDLHELQLRSYESRRKS